VGQIFLIVVVVAFSVMVEVATTVVTVVTGVVVSCVVVKVVEVTVRVAVNGVPRMVRALVVCWVRIAVWTSCEQAAEIWDGR